MNELAAHLKRQTIERYEYLVADGFARYEPLLAEARARPDSYWESIASISEEYYKA